MQIIIQQYKHDLRKKLNFFPKQIHITSCLTKSDLNICVAQPLDPKTFDIGRMILKTL